MRRVGAPRLSARRVSACVLAIAAVLSIASPAGADTGSAAGEEDAAVDRVLIISLPYVAWTDLNDAELPNLNRLLDRSAIANLSTRAPTLAVNLAGGYITFGSGDKAVGADTLGDGAALGVDEDFGGDTAAQVFDQRTGRRVSRGIVHLGIAEIEAANEASIFAADVGVLGDALEDAGYSRAVIANGDGSQPPQAEDTYRREAVAALMGSDGTLGGGDVDRSLLERAPTFPFGLRTDLDAYDAAFIKAWKSRSVVLVEASDLVRADAYLPLADDPAKDVLHARALRRADELVGRLLEQVDPATDAVMVAGPAPSGEEPMLTVAALRAPGFGPGFLRSPTTQRAGFAQLTDLAPTILDLVGVARPDSMRGRVLQGRDSGRDAAERRSFLADADAAARFRDRIHTPVAALFVAFQFLLILGAVLALTRVGRLRVSPILPTFVSVLLAYIPAVYLARLFPLHDAGIVAYYAFIVGAAIVLGLAARWIGRRNEVDPLLIGLGSIVFLLVADVVLLGSRLQFNSALGFSPEVAGRFVGYGNAGYANLAGAAVLFAGLVAHRVPGARGVRLALGTLVAVAAATGVDLLRAPGQRTHLGRLAEQVRDEGLSAFTSVVGRKIEMNLATLSTSVWRLLVPVALAFVAYLGLSAPRHLQHLLERIPAVRAALIGFGVTMVLGYALNDSGIVVPGVMLGVLCPVLVTLIVPARAPVEASAKQPPAKRPTAKRKVAAR